MEESMSAPLPGGNQRNTLLGLRAGQAEAIRNATGHLAILGNVAKKTLLKLREMAAME
jgi:hypothetical protein